MTIQQIWTEFKTELVRRMSATETELIAEVGSQDATGSFGDFDLLVILNQDAAEPMAWDHYERLLAQVQSLEAEIHEAYQIPISHFANFQTQPFYKVAVDQFHTSHSKESILVHLLAYSSVVQMTEWETVSIVASLCRNCDVLHGDPAILRSVTDGLDWPPFAERIQPLLCLFWEGYSVLWQGSSISESSRLAMASAIKQLQYVVKYTAWEALLEHAQEIPVPHIDRLQRDIMHLEPELHDLLRFTRRLSMDCSFEEARCAYKKAYPILAGLQLNCAAH